MSFSLNHSLRYGLLCGVSLLVAGCQSAPPTSAANGQPVPLTKVEQAEVPATEVAAPAAVDEGLETRVATLEGKMAQEVEPRLKKIDVIENHFQALSLELKTIAATSAVAVAESEAVTEKVPAPAPKAETVKPTPKPVAKQKPAVKPAPAAKAEGLKVKTLRFGAQENGKVRIVLDATAAAAMNYDLDNAEGILLIDLPKAGWMAGEPVVPKSSALLKNAHVKTDESGSHLIIELAGKAKVLATGRLTPSGSYGHRVYLDVAPTQ